MRLIDSRGRLFGLINVIDLGALVLVGSLVPFGVFAYRLRLEKQRQVQETMRVALMAEQQAAVAEQQAAVAEQQAAVAEQQAAVAAAAVEPPPIPKKQWVEVDVRFRELMPDLLEVVRAGDTDVAVSEERVSPPTDYHVMLMSVALEQRQGARKFFRSRQMPSVLQDVVMRFRALASNTEGWPAVEGQPVRVGEDFTFSTPRYVLQHGVVTDVKWVGPMPDQPES